MGYKDPIPKKHGRLRSVQQSRYLVSLLVAIVVTGILVFVSCFMAWFHLGGGAWRSEVAVVDAELRSPDGLALIIASCNGGPGVTLKETDIDVQVKAVAYSTPLRGGGDCLDLVGPRSLSEKQYSKRYTSLVECKDANYSTAKSRLL